MPHSERSLEARAAIAAALITAYPKRYNPPGGRYFLRDIGTDVAKVMERIDPAPKEKVHV